LIQIPQAGYACTTVQCKFISTYSARSTGPQNRDQLKQSEQALQYRVSFTGDKSRPGHRNFWQWAFLQTMMKQYISSVYATQ